MKFSPKTNDLLAAPNIVGPSSPCSHMSSAFLPPQHRRTSETSISPPGSSIGSPNRVICVSTVLTLLSAGRTDAPAPGKGAAVPSVVLHCEASPKGRAQLLGTAQTSHAPLSQKHAMLPVPLAQSRSARRGTVPPSQLLCPFPLLPLRHLLFLTCFCCWPELGSVCSVLAPHCALQPSLPSLLLFLSVFLSVSPSP